MPQEKTATVLEDRPAKDDAEERDLATAEKAGEGDPQANANELDDETAEKGKRLGGWQRKIRKLEQEREVLIQALRGGGNANATQETGKPEDDKPPAKPIRPRQGDFAKWEDYENALGRYEDERDQYHEANLAYQLKQAENSRQQKSEQQTVADSFAAQVAEAKQTRPDFEDVAFSEDVPMSPPMMDAIVTSEFGAEIAYELGSNPEEAARIAQLPPIVAIREIGKIESRIANKKSAAEESEEEPAATTRAPKPPSPVRRASASNPDPSDSDDYKTWLRKRNAQLKRK